MRSSQQRSWRQKIRSVNWPVVGLALTILPAVTLSLKLFGYKRLLGWLDRTSPPVARTLQSERAPEQVRTIERYARAVALAASRGPVFGTCLSRSLTLQWLLRWRRIEADLCIGVRRQGGIFEAHAWLERNGVVINDRPEVQREFTPLDLPTLPRGVAWH